MILTVPVVLTVFGVLLIAAALFGDNLKAKVFTLPPLKPRGRLLSGFLGVVSIVVSVWLYLSPSPENKPASPTAAETSTSAAAAPSTSVDVSPYRYFSTQVARESNSAIRTPGQGLPSKYLTRKALKIEWNGAGTVSLSGDSEGATSFAVDDILEISFTNLAGEMTGAPVSQDLSKHCTTEEELSGKTGLDLTKHLVPGTNVLHVVIKDNPECGGSRVGSSDIFLIGNFKLLK